MNNFLKKLRRPNPYFLIGIDVMLLLTVLADFLDGESGLKYTAIVGTLAILLIGLNLMAIEKAKQKEE